MSVVSFILAASGIISARVYKPRLYTSVCKVPALQECPAGGGPVRAQLLLYILLILCIKNTLAIFLTEQ